MMAPGYNGQQTTHGLPLHAHLDKVPPGWTPAVAGRYPFRKFKADFLMWCATTTLEDHSIGPALVLRLSGTPKEIGMRLMESESNRRDVEGGNALQHEMMIEFQNERGAQE